MIKNSIEQIKEVKKLTDKTVNIPLIHLVFLAVCFLMWKPKYIKLINISSWFPSNFKDFLLDFSNLIYKNVIPISIAIMITFTIIYLLANYTLFFTKALPKDIEYTDDTTVSWNEYSALRRLLNILYYLVSPLFICYLLIQVLFNPYNFAENFFFQESFTNTNSLIENHYLNEKTLELLNSFFIINIIITLFSIIKSLFEIRYPTDKYSFKSENLSYYIKINSFTEKDTLGQRFETIILKTKYSKKAMFFLVNVQLTEAKLQQNLYDDNSQWINEEIPLGHKRYQIIDKSENLSDILYFFESLKEESNQNTKKS